MVNILSDSNEFSMRIISNDIQLVKLYPEGAAQARFKIRGVKKIFFYCIRRSCKATVWLNSLVSIEIMVVE